MLLAISWYAAVSVIHVRAERIIAEAYKGPSSRPGYNEVVRMLDSDKKVMWSIDLREGESLVEATEHYALFRHSDGQLYRIDAPFTGGFRRVQEAPSPTPINPIVDYSQFVALGKALEPLANLDGGSQDSNQDSQQSSQSTAPAPTPTPNSTPRPVVYAVVVSGNQLRCLDAQSSSVLGTFGPAGKIVSGPQVNGDLCTVIIEGPNGRKANVYRLPGFSGVSSSDISQ